MAEIINGLSLGLQQKFKEYYLELFRKEGKCVSKKENFNTKPVVEQNNKMDSQKDVYYTDIVTKEQETKYQTNIYDILESINKALLIIYVLIYIFILAKLLRIYYLGAERDIRLDAVWMVGFLVFPFAVYLLEVFLFRNISKWLLSAFYSFLSLWNFPNYQTVQYNKSDSL